MPAYSLAASRQLRRSARGDAQVAAPDGGFPRWRAGAADEQLHVRIRHAKRPRRDTRGRGAAAGDQLARYALLLVRQQVARAVQRLRHGAVRKHERGAERDVAAERAVHAAPVRWAVAEGARRCLIRTVGVQRATVQAGRVACAPCERDSVGAILQVAALRGAAAEEEQEADRSKSARRLHRAAQAALALFPPPRAALSRSSMTRPEASCQARLR